MLAGWNQTRFFIVFAGVGWVGGGVGVRGKDMYYVARPVFLVKILNLDNVI